MSDRKPPSSRKRERSRSPRHDRDKDRDRKSSRKERHRSRSKSRSPSRKHSSDRRDGRHRATSPGKTVSRKTSSGVPSSSSSNATSVSSGGASSSSSAASISQRALSSTNTYLMSEDERKAARDAEQAVLDEEMRKRRERVKAWQDAKAQKAAAEATQASAYTPSFTSILDSDPTGSGTHVADETGGVQEAGNEQWNLEDDDEIADEALPDESIPELGAAFDAPPPLAPLGDMPRLPGTEEISEDAADDVVFSMVGSIQHRNSKRHPTIAVSLGSGAHPAPSVTPVAPKVEAVPLSLTRAQEASAAEVKQLAPPTAREAAMPAPVSKKNRFAAAKDITPTQSSGSVAEEDSDLAAVAMDTGDDYDPLEAYMSDLYGGGDVATQDTSTAFLTGGAGKKGKEDVPKISKPKSTAAIDDDSDDSIDDVDNDANPYGSNFITLAQIMGSGVVDSAKTKGSKLPANKALAMERSASAGWESDSAMSTSQYEDETPEERESREEAERLEFINAIRKAREMEEEEEKRVAEEVKLKEQQRQAAAQTSVVDAEEADNDRKKKAKGDDLGRVFASEGDVMEDFEIEAKKKSALELLEEQKRGKELKAIDHGKIQYIPFRKNLYIVPKVLAKLSPEEVKLKREVLHINVRGRQCPCPVDSWEQCGLSDRVLSIIDKYEFKAPFAIQQQAIPAIMCGRDVIGVAKTGSGKTLAFLLPMIRHILDQPPLADGEGPIGLIMAPARELAFQIFNEAKKFCKPLGLRATCVYGGAGIAEQIADMKRGAEIVVCTPGRMIDILTMQAGKLVSFKRVTMVVMDEADRMFDMGFEPQIKMITQNVRPDRQTVLFSATFPKQIEKLAKTILKLPLEIVVGTRSVANKDITQYVEIHDEDEKFLRLLQLLGIWNERGSVLIFVDKQDKCDQLFQDLLKAGYPSLSLHGGKDQVDRDHTLHEFKTLIKTVMVATSVAGRGLDVPEIVCVINYNCPNHLEDYVHRIGRTGRAGRKGTAYTFISPNEDQYSPLMCKALEQAEQPLPAELQTMADAFKEKVSKGEASWASSGFHTKGYTFDASEMNETQKLANMQRRAYEIEQGIINPADAKEEGEDDFYEEDDGGLPTSDAAAPEVDGASQPLGASATSVHGFGGNNSAAMVSAMPVVATVPAPPAGNDSNALLTSISQQAMTPLERAKALAAAMRGPAMSVVPAAQPLVPPPPAGTNLTPEAALARAKQIAMSMSLGGADEAHDYSKMHFNAEFEINDYPPQVRRKVTNRQTLDQVSEMTGVAIISRGSYIPPGKKPELGDVKLYLFIEAPSELQVKQAKLEIQRLLDEEALKAGNQMGGGMTSSSYGRYSVL